MNTVCPACGVAVVPGYVKCPRCHADLPPGAGRARRTTAEPSGTSVATKGFSRTPLVAALVVVAAVLVVLGVRRAVKTNVAAPSPPAEPVEAGRPDRPSEVASAPAVAPVPEPATPASAPQDPRAAGIQLEDTLHRQRLWGRVEITGSRIDVRSGSCADKAMRPAIDGQQALLRGAGLTKLRCLEQSGAVVFERDL